MRNGDAGVEETARLAALARYRILDTPDEAVFDEITALVRTVLGVPMAGVSLIDADRQWSKSRSGPGVGRAIPRAVSFCSHTIRQREPLIVADAILDSRFEANPLVLGPPFIRSYAGAPLRVPGGHNVGALCAIDTVPRCFDGAQIGLLASFAGLVVDELELRLVAQADFLTGVLTRQAFGGVAEKALVRDARGAASSVLITLEIDGFRAINDTLGHAMGDMVLVAVASALSREMRGGDGFGRVGGKSFALVLSDLGLERAQVVAERLRATVEGLRFDEHPALRVTASFGLATIDHRVTDVEGWLARADGALAAARAAGRNRCCVAD